MSTHPADDSTAPQTSLGPFSSPGASPTSWEATEWALRRIQKFQLCTVRRDDRPHVTPLLAIWALSAMWFTTGDNEQKAFEQAYGWQLTRQDGTWYQLGDAVRTGNVQLYRVQPDKGFAFATGSESSQTR